MPANHFLSPLLRLLLLQFLKDVNNELLRSLLVWMPSS
jgi:hypothetical protein